MDMGLCVIERVRVCSRVGVSTLVLLVLSECVRFDRQDTRLDKEHVKGQGATWSLAPSAGRDDVSRLLPA